MDPTAAPTAPATTASPDAGVSGYDPGFLAVAVPAPVPVDGRVVRELTYSHFTIWLDPTRRLAAATAVNVDGADLAEVDRDGQDWYLDDRLPEAEQAGEELYADNDLDRGHLVRRRDPVWGPVEVAEQANTDTFAFPNAAPQAADFNQSLELWLGLEDEVLAAAEVAGARLSVLTGPVLADDDPTYRDVQVPRMFWKVAAWTTSVDGDVAGTDVDGTGGPVLAATAYVLDQSPQLEDTGVDVEDATAQALAAGGPPPLGPFRTFQVPVADVAALTGLDFGPLVAADRYQDATTQTLEAGQPVPVAGYPPAWRQLTGPGQLTLG